MGDSHYRFQIRNLRNAWGLQGINLSDLRCRVMVRFRVFDLKQSKMEQSPMGLSGDSPESPKPDHNSAHESPEGLKHSVSELQTFVLLFIDPEALFRTETATRMKQKMHMVDANQISRPMCSM